MNSSTETLQAAEAVLAPIGGTVARPETSRLDLTLPVKKLLPAAGALAAAQWGYLATITGLDHGPQTGELEVLYHFCAGSAVVTLRVSTPRSSGVLPSLAAVAPPAVLYERELAEMFGLTFTGGPNTDRLYLPDDWPAGLYPLRKDAHPAPPAPAR